MGRAKGGQHAVYAPPRGQLRHAPVRTVTERPSAQRSAGPAPGARRVHASDLKRNEQMHALAMAIISKALKRGVPSMSAHATEARIGDHLKPMSQAEIFAALKSGSIIELNDGPGHDDMRVLIRDGNGTCVVYSVRAHEVITCWWNDPSDNHQTLNLSNYARLGTPHGDRTLDGILRRGLRCLRD